MDLREDSLESMYNALAEWGRSKDESRRLVQKGHLPEQRPDFPG